MLKEKTILLGVTGSIAAYKSADIARRLKEEGAVVHVVMTEAASRFINPYTFEALTGNPVHSELFKDAFAHINIPKEADLFMIAPATANTISKLSCGIADNLLSSMWLAYEGPVLMAPAMNYRMYRNSLVQKNIKSLKDIGVHFAGPVSGSLACGEEGTGRMIDPQDIVEAAISVMTEKNLSGHKILITAGPTIEPIDPVRFISNRSSGKMGYALAKAAVRRGAEVTLISGPSSLKPPPGVKFISVEKADEMNDSVLEHLPKMTSVIMAAAVCDFAPKLKANVKLKKAQITSLELKKNVDIIKDIGTRKDRPFLVGFAAETGEGMQNAKDKLRDKNLDLIVLNDVSQAQAGFDVDTNIVTIINRKGDVSEYPLMKKIEVADIILDKISGS